MKKLVLINLIFCLITSFYQAQELTDCLKELNKESKVTLSKTKFERVIELSRNRKVYEFSIKSDRRCMDCFNGRIYYDENCKQVARFLMGRGVDEFIAKGYTAGDFGILPRPNPTKNETNEYFENQTYIVGKNRMSEFEIFEIEDEIKLSLKQGLRHFRKGILLNTYKIIPHRIMGSPKSTIYFIDSFQRYFKIINNQFFVTKSKYKDENSSDKIDEKDWLIAFDINKAETDK